LDVNFSSAKTLKTNEKIAHTAVCPIVQASTISCTFIYYDSSRVPVVIETPVLALVATPVVATPVVAVPVDVPVLVPVAAPVLTAVPVAIIVVSFVSSSTTSPLSEQC